MVSFLDFYFFHLRQQFKVAIIQDSPGFQCETPMVAEMLLYVKGNYFKSSYIDHSSPVPLIACSTYAYHTLKGPLGSYFLSRGYHSMIRNSTGCLQSGLNVTQNVQPSSCFHLKAYLFIRIGYFSSWNMWTVVIWCFKSSELVSLMNRELDSTRPKLPVHYSSCTVMLLSIGELFH